MKKVLELCVLLAILIAYILFSFSQGADTTAKEKELFENYQIEVEEQPSEETILEYDGI